MKLNLGCGAQTPDGWINVDYSLGAKFAKLPFFRSFNRKFKFFKTDWDDNVLIHDLTKKFPWAESSVDIIYTSHFLEHLSKTEGQEFLYECKRVLKRGGLIRIVVPDLNQVIEQYLLGRTRADDFLEKLGVLYGNTSGIKTKLAHLYQYPHKCMYDTQRLLEILESFGIQASARNPFESDINGIENVELKNRTINAVIVEGRIL